MTLQMLKLLKMSFSGGGVRKLRGIVKYQSLLVHNRLTNPQPKDTTIQVSNIALVGNHICKGKVLKVNL